MKTSNASFYRLISQAINDFMIHGYTQKRMEYWLERIAIAAEASLTPIAVIERALHVSLLKVFTRATSDKQLFKVHKGISQYTLASIKPKLHGLLEERIRASVDLIKLNREKVIPEQLGRFAGWCSSVPVTGIPPDKRVKTRKQVRRGLAGLDYNSRRVSIDQGFKLVSAINELIAHDGGAIAGIFHSHWRETGYDYRPDHKAMDEKIYVISDNWMLKQGFMKLAGRQYTDQVDTPGMPVFCRCYYQFLYNARDLPNDMLTEKGRAELMRVRAQIAQWKVAA